MPSVKPLSLSYYLALIGLFLPVLFLVKVLPAFSLGIFFLGLLYLARQEIRGDFRPLALKFQVFLILPVLFWTFLTLNSETLIPDFLGLLLVIATVKILGERSVRDLLQIYLLNQFFLVGAAVIRLDLLYAVLFLVEATVSICGLLFLYAAREAPTISRSLARKLGLLGGVSTFTIILFTVFYFLFLPRPRFTLFSAPWGATRTGLSDRVAPGEVSALKEDPSVAFRVRWLSGKRPPRPYFRVFVYGRYQRGVWEALRGKGQLGAQPKGPTFTVEILPQVETRGLPIPGYALWVETLKGLKAILGPEGTVILSSEVYEPSLYRVRGVLSYRGLSRKRNTPRPSGPSPSKERVPGPPPGLPLQGGGENSPLCKGSQGGSDPLRKGGHSPKRTFTYVPEDLRKALLPLAERLKRASPLETAREVERYLRRNYTYTLKPGKPEGDPLLWFLFKARRGHCEYFATAMTFLLRTLGIPARVVGGYAGGQWNPLGGYYILRQEDAHTWVEVYLPEKGWLSFDPTPGAGKPGLRRPKFLRLRLFWDYLQFKWYYWVVEYDFLKQMRVFRGLERSLGSVSRFRFPEISRKKVLFLTISGLLLLVGLGYVFRHLRPRPSRPVEELVAFFEKAGHPRRKEETLKEYFERLSRVYPQLKPRLLKFLDLYYREAFGGEDTAENQRKLFGLIRKEFKTG